MKLTKAEALTAKKSRTHNLEKKFKSLQTCKVNDTSQLNESNNLGQGVLEQSTPLSNDNLSPQVVSHTSTVVTSTDSTVIWPPAGILRQALMSFSSLGPGEKLPSSNMNDQESTLPKISTNLLNSVDDIKLVLSSTPSVSSSEVVSAKAVPLGPLCAGTFFTESLPLGALSSGTVPFVSLGLPFGSFIQGPLLPTGTLGLPLISVSTSSLSPLSEISTAVVSSAVVQKSPTPVLTNASTNITRPDCCSPAPSPVKVLLPDSYVVTSGHQIITSQFSQTQTSLLSKEEIVKVVYSSVPKMEPCSSHFTQGIQKAMPLPPMSEMKSSLSSHLNVLTQTQNIDKPNKVSSESKLNNSPVVTSMQTVEREEQNPPVHFNSISVSTISGNVGSIKLDSSPDTSSDFGHATAISLSTGTVPIKFHSENSSSSDLSSSIVIPVSTDMILTKVDTHHTSQDISHIVTIPLPMGTAYNNSLSIPMPLTVPCGESRSSTSSVQITSSAMPNLSSSASGISNMTSSSVWCCSNSVPSVTTETLQTTSSRPTPPFTQTVPVTSVPSAVSTSNTAFTSSTISIPSSLSTITNTVSATSGRSCTLQDQTAYTMQSPAEILSQLSKAGVLPAMSSSQVSSVLSALGSESHLDMEPDVTQHGEMITSQVLQVNKVSTLTQTDDLELDEKAESPCGALDDSLMAQQMIHMLAQPPSEPHTAGNNNQKSNVVPNVLSQNGTGPNTYPGIVAMVLNSDTKVVLPLSAVSVPGSNLREIMEKSSDTKLADRLLDLPQVESTVELPALENNLRNLLGPSKPTRIQKQPRRTSSLREMLLGSGENDLVKHTANSVFVKQETGSFSSNQKAKKPVGRPKKIKCETGNSDDSTKTKCNKKVKRVASNLEEDSGESISSIMEEVACFKCKFCPFLSLERNSMTLHVQQKHTRKATQMSDTRQKLKCPGCSNVFFATNSLEVHLRQDHQVVEPELKTIIESAVKVSEKNQIKQKQLETKSRGEVDEVGSKSELGKEKLSSVTHSNCNIPDMDEGNKIRVRNLNSKPERVKAKNSAAKEESNVRDGSSESDNKEVIVIDPLVQQKQMSMDVFTYRVINTDDVALMTLNDSVEEKKKETTVCVRKRGRPKGSKKECMLVGSSNNGEHSQDYRCNINNCAVLLHSHDNIEYHRRCHDGSVYRCPECAHSHGHWSGMSIHLWRCHVIDMELYTCDQCNYKTNSYARLVNLHKVIHGTERPFLCDSCGKGFKNRKQLRNHKAIHVARSRPKQPKIGECEVCGRGFTNKRMLRMHLDNVHNKLRPHLCNYCGYSASSVSGLKMHMRKHTGEKPFQCNQCDYCTSDHNSLRRHKMRHTGYKPYKCPHCSYACIQSSTYKAHLKTKHPGMDDGLMFSCDICSFRSVKEDNYFAHMSEHNTSKSPHSWTRKSHPKQTIQEPASPPVVINISTEMSTFSSTITVTPDFEAEEITGDIHEPKELKFVVRKEEGQ